MFYCEFYGDQEGVLERIEELKEDDFYEEDFHLLGLDEGDDMKWLHYTNINFHPHYMDESDGGLRGMFSNNEPAHRYLHKRNLDEDTVHEYLNRLSNGEFLLYYSDENKKQRYNDQIGKDVTSESDLETMDVPSDYDYPK